MAHEVMHPALQHHTRRGDRDRKRWNIACDYAINPLLLDAGLTLPKDVLIEHRFRGMSAERIYNLIDEQQDQDSSTERRKCGWCCFWRRWRKTTRQEECERRAHCASNTGGIGQVLDAPQPEGDDGDTVAEQAREWKIAVEQAENVAKLAGRLPAGVTRSLEQSQAAGVDWRELLRRAWSETIPSDYSWMPPNRRHIWAGLHLPGVRSEGAGEIAIAVDCSGSINARQLGLFEAEVRSILEGQRPSRVHVLYFDTEVHKAEVYQAGQPISLLAGRRRRNELRVLLQLVGRAWTSPADTGVPYRPLRSIPQRGSSLPGALGLHGVAPGAIRAGYSDGSGLAPASVAWIFSFLRY